MEYLRGIASLAVAWFHLTNTYSHGFASWTGSYGWLGVDVFFVLSGFIIPYSLWSGDRAPSLRTFVDFLGRRIVRLEPPYFASLILVLVLAYVSAATPGFRGPPPEYTVPQVALHLFYMIPLTHYPWLQPVYWSLAYEFVFYLAAGLAYWVLSGKNTASCLIASLLLLSAVATGWLPPRFLLFVIGVYLFRNVAGLETLGISIAVACCAGLAIAHYESVATGIVGILTALMIKLGRNIEMQRTTGKLLLFLGAISYSLYLVHVPIGGRVVNLGSRIITEPLEQFFLSIFALMISIGFAWVFYRAVERPSARLSRHLSQKQNLLGFAPN